MRPVSRPWERYEWLAQHDIFEHACFAVSTSADVQHVIEVFAADPDPVLIGRFGEAWSCDSDSDEFGSESGINDIVEIAALGGCTVAIEPNGWTGSEHAVAEELSRGGRYAAFFNSISGASVFVFAVDGTVVRTFDVVLYDEVGAVGERLPEEAGLPFDERRQRTAAVFALIERLTGARIEKDWLINGPRPAYRHGDPTSAT